ncbi:MAG TPA: hypothetical protein VFR41_07960 [Acidimicrobiia bacterium]|nr:hypothetical protein [Acidimicrobiia bacterium]
MRLKLTVLAAGCALALVIGGAGPAFAGEVTGPPGTPGVAFSGSGVRTGAPAHSQSICSYNGLNDMNPDQGPIDSIVQTPHTQGSPGDAGHGTCAGGTNPENQPTP